MLAIRATAFVKQFPQISLPLDPLFSHASESVIKSSFFFFILASVMLKKNVIFFLAVYLEEQSVFTVYSHFLLITAYE
jgi:hypothetical protein